MQTYTGKKLIYPFVSVVALIIILISFSYFLGYIDSVKGTPYQDILHSYFQPIDFSIPVFILLYGALMLFVLLHRKNFSVLHMFVNSYALVTLLRILSIWIFHLDAPKESIPLNDPLLNHFFYAENYIAKDLFFSGHTATLLLCAFLSEGKWRMIFFIFALAVGIMLIGQRVHYTIDVIFAPVFTWIAFYFSRFIHLKLTSVKTAR